MKRLFISGAAGLVGQNLIPRLKGAGGWDITAVDKHPANTEILRSLHPDVMVIEADMAEPGPWEEALAEADACVLLQAQIGGLDERAFQRNNVISTKRALAAAKRGGCDYVVHVSSSVVNSQAVDFYTESKKAQETLVAESGLAHVVLRPTLMFGWFDRKHLGWLARFMKRAPVFPIPGDGRYLRQPLYAGDFSAIIAACLARRATGAYDISGLEKIDYIDLIRALKTAAGAQAAVINIPFRLFWALLWLYALVDRDPPFTTKQLEALIIPETFPEIDWPAIFGVEPTPLAAALEATFQHPQYSKIVLEF